MLHPMFHTQSSTIPKYQMASRYQVIYFSAKVKQPFETMQ